MEPYDKFVEIGRVAFISKGVDQGKLCVIVDVIDQNRALVDGPCSDVKRKSENFKNLQLTSFKMNFSHSAGSKVIKKEWESADITKKWNESDWARNLEKKRLRSLLTDFDRFILMKNKQARNRIIRDKYFCLKKAQRREAFPKTLGSKPPKEKKLADVKPKEKAPPKEKKPAKEKKKADPQT